MAFVVAALVGFAFGGADQYLGSRVMLGPWASTVSVVSAPWLLLPFAFGYTQVIPRRAVLIGLVSTAAALVGYFALTLSPIEGVRAGDAPAGVVHLIAGGQFRYLIGGAVTGPLYGLLGQRWRVHRAWSSAALVAGALCLEPLARRSVGQLWPPLYVWEIELAVGAAVAAAFAMWLALHRRAVARA